MPGAPVLKLKEKQKKRKELLAKKKYVKPKAKSKDKIVKEKKETNKKTLRNQGPINKNRHPNAMKPKDRKKYEGPTLTDIIKGGINKITGGGKAKADELTGARRSSGPKDKRKSAKGKSVRIMKAEKARRSKIKPAVTGRSSAASGAYKKHEAAARKKHVLGTLKKKPSGKR